MLVEAQDKASFGQHTSKRGLAHFQRITPQVVPVQLNQVEGVEKGTVVVTVVANEIERRHAVVVAGNRLSIDDAGARAQADERLDDQRVKSLPGRLFSLTRSPSLRAMIRNPSCLISCSHRPSD